jgi:hypothetical protein
LDATTFCAACLRAQTWDMLGLSAGAKVLVRDLWSKTALGTSSGSFVAKAVPSHGSVLVKLTLGA